MAPHSECPQTMISVIGSVESPKLDGCGLGAVRGARFLVGRNQVADITDDEQIAGAPWRRTGSAPPRLSEQAINRVSGRWPSASRAKVSLDRGTYVLAKIDDAVEQFFSQCLDSPERLKDPRPAARDTPVPRRANFNF